MIVTMIVMTMSMMMLDIASQVGNGHNWCSPYKQWQAQYMNDPLAILENQVRGDNQYGSDHGPVNNDGYPAQHMKDPFAILCMWMMTQMNRDVNDCSQNHCHHNNTGCDES